MSIRFRIEPDPIDPFDDEAWEEIGAYDIEDGTAKCGWSGMVARGLSEEPGGR